MSNNLIEENIDVNVENVNVENENVNNENITVENVENVTMENVENVSVVNVSVENVENVSVVNMNNFIDQAKQIIINKTALTLEGGGVLGIAEVGALRNLYDMGGLRNMTHITGTSVGSVIAASLACGASVDYIEKQLFGLDLPSFKDGKCAISNAYRFLKKGGYGWYKGDAIETLMGNIMKDLTGNANVTFLEAFNKFGIRLTIVYFSVNYNQTCYADYKTEPNLQIKHAVKRSSAIPAFYSAVWDQKDESTTKWYKKLFNKIFKKDYLVYVDGGITDNYPIHVLKDQGCPLNSIIGLKLCSPVEFNEYKEDMNLPIDVPVDNGPPTNIYNHIMQLIGVVHNQALRYHIHKEDWKLTVKINIGNYQTTDFGITKEQQLWLYNEGKLALDSHINDVADLISQGVYPIDGSVTNLSTSPLDY